MLVATDLGVDVFCDAESTEGVRGTLLAAGAIEVTEAAAELVRVESGRPRYGVDLDENVIPQEAGLNERAVSFTKGCYVGQETVARLFYRGKPNRHLRGLRLSAPVEPGTPLQLGEKEVGRLTSVAVSPAHGPIGLALVRRAGRARRARSRPARRRHRRGRRTAVPASDSHCTLLRTGVQSAVDPVSRRSRRWLPRARPRQRHRRFR